MTTKWQRINDIKVKKVSVVLVAPSLSMVQCKLDGTGCLFSAVIASVIFNELRKLLEELSLRLECL